MTDGISQTETCTNLRLSIQSFIHVGDPISFGTIIQRKGIDTKQENPSEIFISSVWIFITSHTQTHTNRRCFVLF